MIFAFKCEAVHCVALFIPSKEGCQLLSLTLTRLHSKKLQWTFMAWFEICDSVLINFSSLSTGAKVLLLCLDSYFSMAARLQNGNKSRQLDFHTPGISAFTFFLVLRFLCHSSLMYVFYFAHFYDDLYDYSLYTIGLEDKSGGWDTDLGSEINHLHILKLMPEAVFVCPSALHHCTFYTLSQMLHIS